MIKKRLRKSLNPPCHIQLNSIQLGENLAVLFRFDIYYTAHIATGANLAKMVFYFTKKNSKNVDSAAFAFLCNKNHSKIKTK